MINLTNHVCSKCAHRNRYERTQHGTLTESYRSTQKKIDRDIKRNYYKMIPYYRRELERLMWSIQDIEKGVHPVDYLYHHEVNPFVISIDVDLEAQRQHIARQNYHYDQEDT